MCSFDRKAKGGREKTRNAGTALVLKFSQIQVVDDCLEKRLRRSATSAVRMDADQLCCVSEQITGVGIVSGVCGHVMSGVCVSGSSCVKKSLQNVVLSLFIFIGQMCLCEL